MIYQFILKIYNATLFSDYFDLFMVYNFTLNLELIRILLKCIFFQGKPSALAKGQANDSQP